MTIVVQNRLCEQQTFHTIHLVIQLVSISYTNPKIFKVPFKTQPHSIWELVKGLLINMEITKYTS
jgi:hypothetical protein